VVVRRGDVYTLLTDAPDNRRPLNWERHPVDLLTLEGRVFECPLLADALRHDVAARFTRAGSTANPRLINGVVVDTEEQHLGQDVRNVPRVNRSAAEQR